MSDYPGALANLAHNEPGPAELSASFLLLQGCSYELYVRHTSAVCCQNRRNIYFLAVTGGLVSDRPDEEVESIRSNVDDISDIRS